MTLGGIDLATYRFTAGQHTNSNVGLMGMCDFPVRTGKILQSWAEQKSVEPYVEADEIFFAGRDLQLIGYVRGHNKATTAANARAIISLADSFTELVPFVSEFGSFNVKVMDIQTAYLSDYASSVLINMREPIVEMAGEEPSPDNAQYGIDKISFEALGCKLLYVGGDYENRPKPKEQFFTAYGKEGFQITKTEAPKLEIHLACKASNYTGFKACIDSLQALLKSPGTRLINTPNNMLREFFVADGFTVTNMLIGSNYCFGLITIKAIETFIFDGLSPITDNSGEFITDNYNNKIYGR